ncbi:MAG: hypothetical protein RRA94_04350 [Bacteroidota bacterium]|nr:hypothetical protein [Bacteroidota bacterium]
MRFPFHVPLLLVLFLFAGCSDDDTPTDPTGQTPDYFPFDREIVWTYETNVFKDALGPQPATMQMKIDTASRGGQLFDWIALHVPALDDEWHNILGILDSAGTIYSLGDHPREGVFPMFKHQYADSEIERETITIRGTTYQTVKLTVNGSNNASVTWWFADGIGLVREHSLKGMSIFSDDNPGDEVLTELLSFTR